SRQVRRGERDGEVPDLQPLLRGSPVPGDDRHGPGLVDGKHPVLERLLMRAGRSIPLSVALAATLVAGTALAAEPARAPARAPSATPGASPRADAVPTDSLRDV